jgi:hypothetical protein
MSALDAELEALRRRAQQMKGGPAKGALLAWSERLEAARALDAREEVPPPVDQPLRHGVFDNRATQRRETWTLGVLGQAIPAARCRSKPFGYYPDAEGE